MRNLFTSLCDDARQALCRIIEINIQIFMNASNGGAHALAIGDNGFALIDEFFNQTADADFVFAIGAFERSDFGMDNGF